MEPGARTPEDLETLLEDALITRDRAALESILEPKAVITGSEFFAGCSRVFQAHDTALLVAPDSLGVALRRNGRWRFAIALLDTNNTNGVKRHD